MSITLHLAILNVGFIFLSFGVADLSESHQSDLAFTILNNSVISLSFVISIHTPSWVIYEYAELNGSHYTHTHTHGIPWVTCASYSHALFPGVLPHLVTN